VAQDDFEKMSLAVKVKVLSKKLRIACKKNPTLIVLFFGSAISRLYYVMFSTFWLLYLLSFVGTYYDKAGAQDIYSRVMLCSVAGGVIVAPLIGKAVDSVNPKIVIPIIFSLRFVAIVLFLLVQDPTSWYSYVCATLMVMGTTCEEITTSSLIYRNADKEIRGVISGVQNMTVYACTFFFTLAGGLMYDHIGPKSPFVTVGIFDISFAILVIILGQMGYVKNDIAERKRKQFEI
jgi:MFS family permease